MKDKFLSLITRYRQKSSFLDRQYKLLKKWYSARTDGHPDWSRIISSDREMWAAALKKSKQGPKVLIGTSVGQYFAGTNMESILAAALTVRGADVHVLLCDTFLPACLACDVSWYPHQESFVKHGPRRDICKDCFQPARAMYESMGVTIHRYGELVTAADQVWVDNVASTTPFDEIAGFVQNDCKVGEHALAGTLRFFARGTLEGEPYADPILRRYFRAALLTACAARRLFEKIDFDAAVFHHGIYVPQGLIGEVARQKKVRVVNWNPAYRKQCFIFSHNDTYHHTLLSEPVNQWDAIEWNSRVESSLLQYLKSRWEGTQDWIWFHESPNFDVTDIVSETGIDLGRPSVGLLTNVLWDAQLHYPANAFANMLDWIVQTIEYFAKRPEVNLLIRVHPAEIRGTLPARQTVMDEIIKVFPQLPGNVFVIPPESHISTYVAMSLCDSVIIYGTKTGVELTSMGIPVLVAGEAWVRNKGITLDASSAEEYFRLLNRLPLKERMEDEKIQRARKYAYHFFFRRMIPLEFFEPTGKNPPYKVGRNELDQFLPGRSRGLDVICNGILHGTSFVYPAEQYDDDA